METVPLATGTIGLFWCLSSKHCCLVQTVQQVQFQSSAIKDMNENDNSVKSVKYVAKFEGKYLKGCRILPATMLATANS